MATTYTFQHEACLKLTSAVDCFRNVPFVADASSRLNDVVFGLARDCRQGVSVSVLLMILSSRLACLPAGHLTPAKHTCWTLIRSSASAAESSSCKAASRDPYLQARDVDMEAVEHGKYAGEVKRACEAVRLSSALCQVRHPRIEYGGLDSRRKRRAERYCLQKVQLQLKRTEATSKMDASPVTVADYGTRQRACSVLASDLLHRACRI